MSRRDTAAVLLVMQRGGSLDGVSYQIRPGRVGRVYQNANEAAAVIEAVEGSTTLSTNGRDIRRLRLASVGHDVRRADIVHLQSPTVFIAIVCTLWACLYRRPTLLVLRSVARQPTSVGRRDRISSRCFGGAVARYAARVVVQDEESRNRMLARNVESSRIELHPTTDVSTFYLSLYEDVTEFRTASGRSAGRPSNPLLWRAGKRSSRTRSVRRRRVALVLASVGIALVATVVLTPIGKSLNHQLSLSFVRQSEPYTAVFLPDPLLLPKNVKVGDPVKFTFAITNRGGRAVTYHYVVSESTVGTPHPGGNVRVAAGKTVRVPVIISASPTPSDQTVRVTVTPSGLSVTFHLHVRT